MGHPVLSSYPVSGWSIGELGDGLQSLNGLEKDIGGAHLESPVKNDLPHPGANPTFTSAGIQLGR